MSPCEERVEAPMFDLGIDDLSDPDFTADRLVSILVLFEDGTWGVHEGNEFTLSGRVE